MRKLFTCITLALLAVLASACQAEATPIVLPTLAEISTQVSEAAATATVSEETATVEVTDEATETAEVTEEATATIATTATPRASRTPAPTFTITVEGTPGRPTATSTPDVAASATSAIEEAPRFATITAAPPNSQVQPTTTPIIVADVIITEAQFQEDLNLKIAAYPDIQTAFVNFTPGGVVLTLTASGGDALITGEITILFQVDTGLVYITIGTVDVNAAQIPDPYAMAINNMYQAVIETMDGILRQRLGNLSDLENVVFTESTMNITLLVPLDVATNTP